VLTATGYAVLGLLSFGESLSGYDLKRWADHSLRYFFWSPAQSAIYTELRRLEELGYVRALGPSQGPRGRQRFGITATGRRALESWVASSQPAPRVVKDQTLLKVWLGHVANRDSLLELVDSERHAAEDLLNEIRYSAARAEAVAPRHVALVEHCCERMAAARADALQELSEALHEERWTKVGS
jgi:DNA-binding PadR family transcriptional regulator